MNSENSFFYSGGFQNWDVKNLVTKLRTRTRIEKIVDLRNREVVKKVSPFSTEIGIQEDPNIMIGAGSTENNPKGTGIWIHFLVIEGT